MFTFFQLQTYQQKYVQLQTCLICMCPFKVLLASRSGDSRVDCWCVHTSWHPPLTQPNPYLSHILFHICQKIINIIYLCIFSCLDSSMPSLRSLSWTLPLWNLTTESDSTSRHFKTQDSRTPKSSWKCLKRKSLNEYESWPMTCMYADLLSVDRIRDDP